MPSVFLKKRNQSTEVGYKYSLAHILARLKKEIGPPQGLYHVTIKVLLILWVTVPNHVIIPYILFFGDPWVHFNKLVKPNAPVCQKKPVIALTMLVGSHARENAAKISGQPEIKDLPKSETETWLFFLVYTVYQRSRTCLMNKVRTMSKFEKFSKETF